MIQFDSWMYLYFTFISMKPSSPWKNGIITWFVFFLTVAILSIWYATFSSLLSVNDKVGTGSGLSSGSWNRIVDSLLELDGRTFGITSSGGNIGVGTSSPGTKLEVNGDMKVSGGITGAGFGQLYYSTMPNDMSFWSGGFVLGASTNPMPIGIYFFQIYGCNGQNNFTSWTLGSFVFVSGSGTASKIDYLDNVNVWAGSCGYFRSGVIQVTVANSVMQLKLNSYLGWANYDLNPTANAFQVVITRIF